MIPQYEASVNSKLVHWAGQSHQPEVARRSGCCRPCQPRSLVGDYPLRSTVYVSCLKVGQVTPECQPVIRALAFTTGSAQQLQYPAYARHTPVLPCCGTVSLPTTRPAEIECCVAELVFLLLRTKWGRTPIAWHESMFLAVERKGLMSRSP